LPWHAQSFYSERIDFDHVAKDLGRFTQQVELGPGETLFSEGAAADEIYIIESGSIVCRGSILKSSLEEQGLPEDLAIHAPVRCGATDTRILLFY
jgi:hypothetical protein